MYILKNAIRCISRSKGRNLLIGIITLVIAVSACLGLSIRQASETAKKETLESLSVTATISYDRQSMMQNMVKPDEKTEGERKEFDRSEFSSMMNDFSSLSLEEYQTYASAESVKDFYYTLTVSANGSENLEPVSTEEETQEESFGFGGMFQDGRGGKRGMGNAFMSDGDFTVVGFSSDSAMIDFVNGNASVSDGEVFEEGTTDSDCLITEELATFNSLTIGDKITVTNPENEDETYKLKIVGIYKSSETNDTSFSAFSTSQDPANKIYMSAAALQSIVDKSETSSETDTALKGILSATYVFDSTDAYYQFEEDVRTLGLDESYTVSSADLMSYENSLMPLNTLSTMAGWFLIVILIIGAVILVVLNIFNVRERKYEVGVLTAMGMKKRKVALQFVTEILIVTMVSVILGAAMGAVSSVPLTNKLLESQTTSQQSQQTQIQNNFGRGEMPPDMQGGQMTDKGSFKDMFRENTVQYITEVNSAMNLTVVLQMLLIGLLLTLIASAFSIMFVMRYDPLKILANRD